MTTLPRLGLSNPKLELAKLINSKRKALLNFTAYRLLLKIFREVTKQVASYLYNCRRKKLTQGIKISLKRHRFA